MDERYKEVILKIGAGEEPKESGFINFDIRPLPNIDVVGDAKSLPFDNESFGGIKSRNLIEHFDRNEIDGVFKEWARVMKSHGTFVIETVDMGRLMDNWRDIPEEELLDGILGKQTYDENYHKMAFTEPILISKLEKAGFTVLEIATFTHRQIPRISVHGIKL